MTRLTETRAFVFAFGAAGLAVLAALGTALALRPPAAARPLPSEKGLAPSAQAIGQGRRLFVAHCAECHGFDARGAGGSNLRSLQAGNALIRQVIAGGIKGEMPAYRDALSDEDVQALTAYLISLRN